MLLLTSKSLSNMLTYSFRTPSDLPIEARNITHRIKSRNGVYNIDIATDTNAIINAILTTDDDYLFCDGLIVDWFVIESAGQRCGQ